MASPRPDLDIEAQTNRSTDTWPESVPVSPPSANPQLPATPEPLAQDAHTNRHHYENAARKTTEKLGVQQGI
jgi:hypothetical protein